MVASLALLAMSMVAPALSQQAGSIVDAGDTLVSAMMMFLGNEEKVYITDKAEANAARINDHPAWASVYDIATGQATLMDFKSNAFCASGMHLPNGSFTTFGGNGAIGPAGNLGSVPNNEGSASFDATYKDFDGARSIRIVTPCTSAQFSSGANCDWFDDASVLSMNRKRWYSTAEALADGSIVVIGGFQNGGYINRNYPNLNPDDGAENSYEFFPDNGRGAKPMPFMRMTSGLNSYAHAFLMPSGKMFVQANYSTIMWDYNTAEETPLPDMPGEVIRVYPASGAVAMLPLTPANNWTPTLLFCGGQDMKDFEWGNFSWPFIDTWDRPASKDCQRITPEPQDGSAPAYVQDDDMLEGRTMGQFITLPTGQLLVVNGGINGTAGYSTQTLLTTSYSDMPLGMSLAAGPVGTPALYDPNAPQGSRWSNKGLGESKIPRLYHSSALLLPDASVLIAGSNPNVDVNTSTIFPTTYKAERFYPPYFAASTRPAPSGIPKTITYGGDSFDITIPASSYAGSANDAAGNASCVLIRPGWTTHAMNMGQRMVQLNNTYTVNKDGTIILHTSQAPPNPNLLTPGPVLFFVVINGIPSKGTMVIVGSGNIEKQPVADVAALPASVRLEADVSGSGTKTTTTSAGQTSGGADPSESSHTGMVVGGIIAAVAAIGIIGALIGVCVARRRRANRAAQPGASYPMGSSNTGYSGGEPKSYYQPGQRDSDSSAFMPLQENASSISVNHPGQYRDQDGMRPSFDSTNVPYGAAAPPVAPYRGHQYNPSFGAESTHSIPNQPPMQPYDPYYDNSRMR